MNNTHIDEDEIDLKEVFRTIYRYKYMIIFFVIIFTLVSAYIAYFKPNVYKASSTVEVGIERYGSYGGGDVLSMAMSPGAANAETEMEIIRSRFLAAKAAKEVDVLHRYYTIRRFKEVELYKSSPFQVGMLRGYGMSFELYPVDDKQYRLVLPEFKDENKTTVSYDKVLPYGEEIDTPYFHLNVVKTGEMTDSKYRFVVFDPKEEGSIAQGGISVSQLSKYSSILQISYEDNVALRAQEFANALAKAYLQQNIEKKTKEATQKLEFIDKQLKFITENLKSSAVKLEEFKKSSSTISLSAKAETVIRQMSEKETQLSEISIEEEMLSRLYQSVKSGKNLESLALVGVDKSKSSLAGMIKELQEAILKKKILRADYTEMHPEVVKLRKTITQLKKVIISTIKNMEKSIKERKVLLEKSIAQLQKKLDKLPADERMFGQLQRKFSVNEKIYSYLLEKRSETAILKAATVSKNRIIDTALLPGAPIKPKRKLIVLVGMILGLIVGIALAFLRAFLDDRIKGEEDISHATNVPLLGMIPHIKEKDAAEKLKVVISPKSAVAESFRHLRTNLQFMEREKKSHIISVTSTIGGEGKTTVSMNLAAIMSMAEKKTILINMDMRKPTLHERFGLENVRGMSTLLSKHTSLAKVIQHTEYTNLDVITSGPVPPNPSELIQGDLMEKVLEKLSEVYDVIIMDTPPVGLVTDARTLMHLSDTSIFVLRAEYSKKGFIKGIDELYKHDGIRGLGILLNDMKMDRSGYGYSYGYGYGYYEEDQK